MIYFQGGGGKMERERSEGQEERRTAGAVPDKHCHAHFLRTPFLVAACWTEATTVVPLCTTSCMKQLNQGLFDKTNDKNPYKDYTIVHIMYCSGDAHAGNSTRSYNDFKGQPVQQVGAINVQTTLDWIVDQTDFWDADGLTDLVISGASAGSLGAQVWADNILTEFKTNLPYQRAAVIPDSYIGVFPDGSQGPTMIDFGVCKSNVLENSPDLLEKCNNSELTLQEISTAAMQRHIDVPFAWIQSKRDVVQKAYFDAIALTVDKTISAIGNVEFYKDCNQIIADYVSNNKNAVSYVVDSLMHTYTLLPIVYSTSSKGVAGGGDDMSMIDWLTQFPMNKGETVKSVCDGSVVDLDNHPSHYTNYCASEAQSSYTQE